jgi:hypothetical protein
MTKANEPAERAIAVVSDSIVESQAERQIIFLSPASRAQPNSSGSILGLAPQALRFRTLRALFITQP